MKGNSFANGNSAYHGGPADPGWLVPVPEIWVGWSDPRPRP